MKKVDYCKLTILENYLSRSQYQASLEDLQKGQSYLMRLSTFSSATLRSFQGVNGECNFLLTYPRLNHLPFVSKLNFTVTAAVRNGLLTAPKMKKGQWKSCQNYHGRSVSSSLSYPFTWMP
jgi:hypothetical protein